MAGDFHGLPTGTLGNQYLRLEYLATAGPRIVRLFLNGSDENLLVEVPQLEQDTAYGKFYLRGGHRLWHAPEDMPRSYLPDNEGLQVEQTDGGVRMTEPKEADSGITKIMDVRLHVDAPAVTVTHMLRNDGLWPIELAPWGLTQLPLGGLAILPQPVGPLAEGALLPNRHLVLWPYTSWQDKRLEVYDDYVLLQAQPKLPPCKVGYLNHKGWVGYLRQGVLFVKRFEPKPNLPHVDFGCNAESYCSDMFIEVETVGPLARLEPGQAATHVETWGLFRGINAPQTIEGVRALAGELVL